MDDKTRDNGEGYAPDTQKEPLRGSQSGDKPLVGIDTSESASELPRGDRGDSHDEPEDSSAKESTSIKKDSEPHESQLHDGLPDFPSLPDVNQLQGSSNESKRNPSSTYRGATKRFFTKTLDYTTSDSRPMFWKPQVVLLAISAIYVAILCYFSAIPSKGVSYDNTLLVLWIIYFLTGLFLTIPMIASIVRRFRDAGVHPWVSAIWFVPLIGAPIVYGLCAKSTKPQLNDHSEK